ncbi:MAG: Na+/H+ antiporter subunit E [Anaerolineae bacterium]|nr:Na+/H+ antiporter subunit E [Anaerolineae bacterium]
MTKLAKFILCAGLYLALTSNLALSNWVLAGLLAGAAVWLSGSSDGRTYTIAQLPSVAGRKLWWAMRYAVALVLDIINSGITVTKMIVDPKLPIRPGLIVVNSGSQNENVIALSAHGITVTPGEQVIEFGLDDEAMAQTGKTYGQMWVHCLDAVSSGASAEAAQARRRAMLEKIFL